MRHGATPTLVGLLAVLMIPTLTVGGEFVLPDSRLGVRTAPLLLLTRPDVRADLELTPAQTDAARRAIAELEPMVMALRGKTGPALIEARRAVDKTQAQWLDTQLTNSQKTRLAQIDLQWEGPSALIRPLIAETLGLTAEQRQTLAQAIAERNRLRAEGHNQRNDERPLAELALSVLTDEQKARWDAMLGRAIPFRTAAVAPPIPTPVNH